MAPLAWLKSTFTWGRWNSNPFQMYDLALLMAFSLAQLMFGPSDTSIQAKDLETKTAAFLAMANIVGGIISMYGLHLKNTETSLLIELWGYLSLIGTMGLYVIMLVLDHEFPNTTYALGLSEAFVFASVHRSVLIIRYKRAENRKHVLLEQLNEIERQDDAC